MLRDGRPDRPGSFTDLPSWRLFSQTIAIKLNVPPADWLCLAQHLRAIEFRQSRWPQDAADPIQAAWSQRAWKLVSVAPPS
jgi:hypothetical protein